MTSSDVSCCHEDTSSKQLSLADDNFKSSDCGRNVSLACPIITLSTDSELADVGESFFSAELPVQSDWSPVIQLSTPLANHISDLLTLQSVDVNDNHVEIDESFSSQLPDDRTNSSRYDNQLAGVSMMSHHRGRLLAMSKI